MSLTCLPFLFLAKILDLCTHFADVSLSSRILDFLISCKLYIAKKKLRWLKEKLVLVLFSTLRGVQYKTNFISNKTLCYVSLGELPKLALDFFLFWFLKYLLTESKREKVYSARSYWKRGVLRQHFFNFGSTKQQFQVIFFSHFIFFLHWKFSAIPTLQFAFLLLSRHTNKSVPLAKFSFFVLLRKRFVTSVSLQTCHIHVSTRFSVYL